MTSNEPLNPDCQVCRLLDGRQHTPGPWSNFGPIVHREGLHIAHVIADSPNEDGHQGNHEQRANTYLIAAAPELLEACKRVLNSLEHNLADEFLPETRAALRDAIAKAEAR